MTTMADCGVIRLIFEISTTSGCSGCLIDLLEKWLIELKSGIESKGVQNGLVFLTLYFESEMYRADC